MTEIKLPGAVVPASELVARAGYEALVYGRPGAGKTTLLLTLPRPLAVLDVDCSAREVFPPDDDLLVWPVADGPDAWVEAQRFAAWVPRAAEQGVRSFAIDSLSRLAGFAVQWVVASGAAGGGPKPDRIYLPDESHYGVANRVVLAYVEALRRQALSLGCAVIYTAWEHQDEGDDGQVRVRPLFSPKLGETVAGTVARIGRLYVAKEGRRALRWAPTAAVTAKWRARPGEAAPEVTDATLQQQQE